MAVSALLTRDLGFSEVIEVRAFDEVRPCLLDRPEVSLCLLDFAIPALKASGSLRTFRASFPASKVVVTSATSSRRNILSAMDSGVHGYIPKGLNLVQLTAALRLVLNGGIYVPPSLAEIEPQIPEPIVSLKELPAFADAGVRSPLTARQLDVLELLVQGKPNKEIATALNLGEGTVKVHVAAILRYLGVRNRVAAAAAISRPVLHHRLPASCRISHLEMPARVE
ncbi:response regulator transcription factor [Microvirga terrae]|uniref:Response regulator transcription factor n=1 Tax=Microvirga terrae TaxID=2740529 RepID=A0ABY5RXQ0_9HYPH|nr:response regulator transcription factor [Microvirga terrae]UVF22040.1 response regulator transcription factor [Microvirga terrae]